MGLLDGGQKEDLAPMSWEPVLDGTTDGDAPEAAAAPDITANDDAPGIGPIHLEITALGGSEQRSSGDQPPLVSASSDRPIGIPEPLPLPASDEPADLGTFSFSIPDLLSTATDESPAGGPPAEPDADRRVPSAPPAAPAAAPTTTFPSPHPTPLPAAAAPPPPPAPAPPVTAAPVAESVVPPLPLTAEPVPAAPVAESVVPPLPLTAEPVTAAPVAESVVPPLPLTAEPVPATPVAESVVPPSLLTAEPEPAAPVAESVPAPPVAPGPPPVPGVAAPVVPAVAPPVHQPIQHGAAPVAYSHPASAKGSARRNRDGGRRVVSFMFILIVLAAAVAAGVIFGRPYLFPDDWDPAIKPYAQAVEEALAVEFEEPVTVVAEESAQYEMRRSMLLLGDWESQLSTWRALALANGQVDQESIDMLLAGRSPALYSLEDGRVYHDAALTGPELDAHLTLVMAEVALDQTLRWSSGPKDESLDAAALTRAHVLHQARAAQRATEFDAPIGDPELTALAFLPPVLDYRLTAPEMYVELLPSPDGAPNPLAAPDGPGPLPDDMPGLATSPVLAEGEVAVGEGVPRDRSFWYLVFASYLDAPQAYAASQAIVDNTLTTTDRAGRACVVASFSGSDAAGAGTLGTALVDWAARAPVEFGASTAAQDGSLQLSSCDPGVGFENGARFGAARELIGYRLGSIATVVELGPDASASEIEAALAAYDASGAGAGLAALPFDTRPADAAASAIAAVSGPPAADITAEA